MSKEDGGPAFPSHGSMGEVVQEGMSLRDYFAAAALQGLLADGHPEYIPPGPARIGVEGIYIQDKAYRLADAMMAARKTK